MISLVLLPRLCLGRERNLNPPLSSLTWMEISASGVCSLFSKWANFIVLENFADQQNLSFLVAFYVQMSFETATGDSVSAKLKCRSFLGT